LFYKPIFDFKCGSFRIWAYKKCGDGSFISPWGNFFINKSDGGGIFAVLEEKLAYKIKSLLVFISPFSKQGVGKGSLGLINYRIIRDL